MTPADTEWKQDGGAEAFSPVDNNGSGETLRVALRRGDALACRRYAEQAGGNQDRSAVRDLCALLRSPGQKHNGRRASLYRKRAWVWARIAAVNALGQIGDPDAPPVLTDALFDPDPAVREAAAFVLPSYGNQALRPLIRALRTRSDWELQSMKLLISTLGALQNRRATPVLLHVLAEQLPADPSRWARQTFMRPFGVLSVATAFWWLTYLIANPPVGEPGWQGWLQALLALLIRSFVPFLFIYMVSVCLVFVPLFNRVAAREREELVASVLQALAALKDKRAIPAVTELAAGPHSGGNHAVMTALQALLPLISAEDDARFPARTRQQLLRALAVAAGLNRSDTQLEIVHALEYVGDGQAVEAVERVAQRGGTLQLRREAARVLLPLRARKRREQAASSLLRAANAPDAPADELLRASDTASDTPPDELLRTPDSE